MSPLAICLSKLHSIKIKSSKYKYSFWHPQVPRLESITREDFISKYAYSGRPLVVTGVTKNWTALNVFSFKYFKKLYNSFEDAFDVQDSNCQFFGYKTNFQGLEQVFGMSKQRAALKGKPWYIGW